MPAGLRLTAPHPDGAGARSAAFQSCSFATERPLSVNARLRPGARPHVPPRRLSDRWAVAIAAPTRAPPRRRGGGTRTCARARASRPLRPPRAELPVAPPLAAGRGVSGPRAAAVGPPARRGAASLSRAEPCRRGATCSAPPCPPRASSPRAATGRGRGLLPGYGCHPRAPPRCSLVRSLSRPLSLSLSLARPPRPLSPPPPPRGADPGAPPAPPPHAAERSGRGAAPRRPAGPLAAPPPLQPGPECMRGGAGRRRPQPLASRPAAAAAQRPARGAARGGGGGPM